MTQQVAAIEVTQHSRTLDGSRASDDEAATLRGLITSDAQALGLPTTQGSGRARASQTAVSPGGSGTLALTVTLTSSERRLTSAYLKGDQWPLRTVTLSLTAAVSDARTGRRLAYMDVPALNLAGNSTFEALADYLSHDFKDALSAMLAVACEEPSMQQSSPSYPPQGQTLIASSARGGSSVPQAPPSGPRIEPHRHIAIVVGISQYQNLPNSVPRGSRNLANLQFADADARDFGSFLKDSSNTGRPWEVYEFVNEQATGARVQNAIAQLLGDARSDDVIILFFAGHGRPVGTQDVALLTYDFDPGTVNSGISFNWTKDQITNSHALQVIAFVDACDSGDVRLGARGTNAAGIDANMLSIEAGVGKMRTVITSTSNGESAYEDARLGHGVFTYFLLKAIRGDAAHTNLNGHQALLLGPIWDYVRANVSRYVDQNKDKFGQYASQRPNSFGNLAADFNDWPVARVQ